MRYMLQDIHIKEGNTNIKSVFTVRYFSELPFNHASLLINQHCNRLRWAEHIHCFVLLSQPAMALWAGFYLSNCVLVPAQEVASFDGEKRRYVLAARCCLMVVCVGGFLCSWSFCIESLTSGSGSTHE